LEERLKDALQYLSYVSFDYRKISSTNVLEQLNREIRRQSRVVGIFSSMDSYLRFITSYLIEYAEDWSTGVTLNSHSLRNNKWHYNRQHKPVISMTSLPEIANIS
jgi:transposase-like protein